MFRTFLPSVVFAIAAPIRSPDATTIEALRELTELGLSAAIVAEAQDEVAPGGPLATDGEAIALVARALFDAGDETRAVALLNDAEPSEASRVWVVAEKARIALARDELRVVIDLLGVDTERGAGLRYPQHAESYLLLGRALFRADRPDKARTLLERFLELAPRHPEAPAAWHMLGQEALVRGDTQRALECREAHGELTKWHSYLKARRFQIRRTPEAPEPRLGLALLWMDAEDWARARTVLEELVAIAPDHCPAWFPLGEALRSLDEPSLAREAFGRAIACDPNDARPRYNRAQLALAASDVDEARADFEALLDSKVEGDPRYAGLHLALARLDRDAGNDAGAKAHYARYRELGGTQPLD